MSGKNWQIKIFRQGTKYMRHIGLGRVTVPICVTSSSDYQALSVEAAHEFVARIQYIQELTQKIFEMKEIHQNKDLLFALNSIELDCLVNLSIRSEPKGYVTPWLLHTSWTFECTPQSLAASVDNEFRTLVMGVDPGFDATLDEIVIWVHSMGKGLERELAKFQGAGKFCDAISSLICVDAILSMLILGFVKMRFNTKIRM